jgi:hypothetical protein
MENLVHSSFVVVDDVAISYHSREATRGIHLAGYKIEKTHTLI